MTGWWKHDTFVCLSCTEAAGEENGKPREMVFGHTYPDPQAGDLNDLSPLQLGVNTVPPSRSD